MTRLNAFKALAVLAAAACLNGAALAGEGDQQEKDIILRTDGKPQPPTFVKQDNYLTVVGDRGEKVHAFLVKDILYANRDANYQMGLDKKDEGRYTLAAFYFAKALSAMSNVKWAEEYCNYYIGCSLYDNGSYKGYTGKSGTAYSPPSVYFKKARDANPKTRFILDITCKLPVCLAEEDKLDEADAAMKEAEKTLKAYRDETNKVADGFRDIADRATALLSIADARIAEKRVAAGKDNMNTVKDKWMIATSRTSKYPELMGDAVDGQLRTLVAMKDYTTAKAEADRYINKYKKDGDQKVVPLLPGAYTVMGKANLAQASEFESKKQEVQAQTAYADARWAFLHVIAQFFDNDEYVASAHYFAGLCYDRLRNIETDAGDKAVRHWKLIVKNFPKSKFKEEAQKELDRVGGGAPAAPKEEPKKEDPKKADAKADPKAAAPAAN
jgi:tetratricopeptide (TPR) repeat protein